MNSAESINDLLDLLLVIARQDKWNHHVDYNYISNFITQNGKAELLPHLKQKYSEKFDVYTQNPNLLSSAVGQDTEAVITLSKRLNKSLKPKEKIIAFALLCEEAKTGDFITTQRSVLLETISAILEIEPQNFSTIKNLVLQIGPYFDTDENTLILDDSALTLYNRVRGVKHQLVETLDKPISVKSLKGFSDLLLFKYFGNKNVNSGGSKIQPGRFFVLYDADLLEGEGFSFTFAELLQIMKKEFTLDTLKLPGKDKTPEIHFDLKAHKLEIKGISIPEDALTFYKPLLHWIGLYLQTKPKKSELVFQMEFFNTVSSRLFLEIMKLMQKLRESGTDVTIRWLYEPDDEDIQEAGENYSQMINVNFLVEPVAS